MLRATLLYPFLIFLPTLVLAGNNERIARCFAENGDIIYSDVFCSTFENNNPHFMTEGDVGRNIRATDLPLISSGTLSSTELASITDHAVSQCAENFKRYFRRKHRSVAEIPLIAFTDITEQYKKGSNVSISVAGTVHYLEGDSNKTGYVECTAQKMNASTSWQVGFLEK
jgi:ribosomal protein L21E